MGYVTDYSGDHAWIDGVETVSYAGDAETAAVVEDAKVRRGEITESLLAQPTTFGAATGDVLMVLWSATIDTVPIEHDLITDAAGVTYRVQGGSMRGDGAQWLLFCRREGTSNAH